MGDRNETCHSATEKSSEEIENGEKEMTKLDQMIEELNKKNPGRDIKKIYGGIY